MNSHFITMMIGAVMGLVVTGLVFTRYINATVNSLRQEAIDRGYAAYVITAGPKIAFKWIEPEETTK